MKKTLIWLIVVSCLIGSVGIQSKKVKATEITVQSSDLVVEDDGYLYYKTGTTGSDYKLVSQKVGASTTTTLTTTKCDEFYVRNSYTYYVSVNTSTSKNSIYRVRKDGKNSKCLVTAFRLNIIGISGNYIYYSYYKSYSKMIIARISVSGKASTKKIIKTTSTNYYNFKPVLTNNKIYYTNNKKTIIYSVTLGGKTTKKLISNTNVDGMMAGNDGLYYLCRQDDGTMKSMTVAVMKVSFDGTLTRLAYIDHQLISDYRVAAGGEAAGDYTTFTVDLEQVTDDFVYYSLTDGEQFSYVFAAATDGSTNESVLDCKNAIGDGNTVMFCYGYQAQDGYDTILLGLEDTVTSCYYRTESELKLLLVKPNSIKIVNGFVYYSTVGKGSKVSYQRTKLSKLFADQ